MNSAIIYIDSDNLITLSDLADTTTGNPILDATVEVTLIDSTGTEVSGATWPLAMELNSVDQYVATLTHELIIENHKHYVATIVAVAGDGVTRTIKRTLVAQYDT
jgi:hypothetical protein